MEHTIPTAVQSAGHQAHRLLLRDHGHVQAVQAPLAPQHREQFPVIPTFVAFQLLDVECFKNQVSDDFLMFPIPIPMYMY
jgi:hypothetical protein